MAVPTALSAARFRAKAGVLQLGRALRDSRCGLERYPRGEVHRDDVMLAESAGPLWAGGANASERGLTLGKVQDCCSPLRWGCR